MVAFKRVLTLACCCACLAGWLTTTQAEAPGAPGPGNLRLHLDLDGDGEYQLAGIYNVTFEDAVRAFAAAGGAPAAGGEEVLNVKRIDGVSFTGPQSWAGFVDFLNNRYRAQSQILTQVDCDNTITVTVADISASVTCSNSNADCVPVNTCDGFYENASARYTCNNDPPCPPEKKDCVQLFRRVNIVAFNANCNVCQCAPDPTFCTRALACTATGAGIVHQGPACSCSSAANNVPGLAPIGILLLTLLLLGTSAWTLRRRFGSGDAAAA